ncbi:hypothetical protein GT354_15485, partial [Streptomyces sp. SID3343]|nr:hypothetical protein [Streptomyces sp. SID3343]
GHPPARPEEIAAIRRLAARRATLTPGRLAELRPLLDRLTTVAAQRPADRAAVLGLALRVCPEPRTDRELSIFTQVAETLAAELGGVDGVSGGEGVSGEPAVDRAAGVAAIAAILAAVVDRLSPGAAFALAARLRALPTQTRTTWSLLGRCGAVRTRDDLDRALAGARTEPDPWAAEVTLLRDAFGATDAPGTESDLPPAEQTLRAALDTAVRTPGAVAALRAQQGPAATSGSTVPAEGIGHVDPA